MTLPSGNRSKIRGNENCIDLDETKSLNLLKAIWIDVCSCRDSISVCGDGDDGGCHSSFFFTVIKSLKCHVSLLAIKQFILFIACSIAHVPNSFGRNRKHCPIVLKLQPVWFDCDDVVVVVGNGENDDDDVDDGNSLYTSLEIENCVDCSMSTNIKIIPLLSLIIFQLFLCLRFKDSECSNVIFSIFSLQSIEYHRARFYCASFYYHLLPVVLNLFSFFLSFFLEIATLLFIFPESLDQLCHTCSRKCSQLKWKCWFNCRWLECKYKTCKSLHCSKKTSLAQIIFKRTRNLKIKHTWAPFSID